MPEEVGHDGIKQVRVDPNPIQRAAALASSAAA
jgi:hypothetical protein